MAPARLLADLHTHSTASGHAYSSINGICEAARARGLEMVAVTDHGPTLSGAPDLQYFANLRVLPVRIAGVRLLTGVEANADAGGDNGLDVPDRILEHLDIVGVGLHPTPGVDPADREANTAALVRALANPLADVLTHPGRGRWLIDVERVARAAAAAGVAVEVNDHSFWHAVPREATAQERAFLHAALDAGCPVSICSDAHYETRVGVFDAALAVAEELGVPADRVVNRDAASVEAFLTARRPRRHMAGEWDR